MNYSKDLSIKLSLSCIYLFAVLLALVNVFAPSITEWYAAWRHMREQTVLYMRITIYTASIFGWACLWALWRLLRNIKAELVFTTENVRLLRIISWCCALAGIIFLISGSYYPPFFLIAVAAGFMMLIVRVVKNVFQQAIEMKSELDLTI